MDKLDVERTQERFHIDGFKSGVLQTVLQFVSTVELHPNLEKQSPTVSSSPKGAIRNSLCLRVVQAMWSFGVVASTGTWDE